MSEWTPERIVSEAEAWVWIPPEAVRVETPHYLVAVVPGTYAYTFVHWFHSPADRAEAIIEELLERVRAAGGTGVRWIVRASSSPPDLAERLLRRGFERRDTAEILYIPLSRDGESALGESRRSKEIAVREATTDEEFDDFRRLSEAVFGDPPFPSNVVESMRAEYHETLTKTGHSGRFLAYEGRTPIGRGGLEVAGAVGRLWGAGVIEARRGRGAYLALVAERCRSAREQGAEVALTMARVGSSGPILKRHGFRIAGAQETLELRPASAP